jgi:hypothetical protein
MAHSLYLPSWGDGCRMTSVRLEIATRKIPPPRHGVPPWQSVVVQGDAATLFITFLLS